MDNPKANYTKSATAMVTAAILLGSMVAFLPLNFATAQAAVTITTSADIHGNSFFGPAIVEVRIQDPALAADNTLNEDVAVSITAFGSTETITVDETSSTSGTLLIYLKADTDNDVANGEEPFFPGSPLNARFTNLIFGQGVFNPAGDYDPSGTFTNSVAVNINVQPLLGGTVMINYGGQSKTLTYVDTPAQIFLDRTNVGPTGTLFAQIYDPDINLDPTRANTILEQVDNELLALAVDAPAASRAFTETGTNTARFEVALNALTALGAGIESESRSLTVNDYDTFISGGLNAVEVDGAATVIGTSDASYVVEIVRGTIQTLPTPSFASELPIVVSDSDRNTNSRSQQSAVGALQINVDGGANQLFNMKEQGTNSNNWVPNYSGDRIRLTFKQATNTAQGILQVVPGSDIVITYLDVQFGSSSIVTTEIPNTAPVLTTEQTTVGQASTVRLNLADADLNDDANVIESYTIQMTTVTGTEATLALGGNDVITLAISIAGQTRTLASNFAVTFTETGANTGVFTANVRLSDLAAAIGGGFTFTDGDTVEFEVTDELDDAAIKSDSSVTVTIGLAKPIVTLDRTTLPVPRNPALVPGNDGALAIPVTAPNLGNSIINITVEDSSANNNNLQQETILGTGNVALTAGQGSSGNFQFTLINPDGVQFAGNGIVSVTTAIRETGLDTGVFAGTIEVTFDPADTPAQWIGSRLRIQYAGQDGLFGTTDDADSRSVTFTARNAILTTNTAFVSNGQTLTITVTDHDANRDTTEVEQVAVSIRWIDSVNGNTVFALRTLDETGPNTGIFTRNIAVGTDTIGGNIFRVASDEEVRVRYYDLTPSIPGSTAYPAPSSSQVQVDLTLQALAVTGGLALTPTERVGPATEILVTVVDSDLNINPNTSDTAVGFVTVVSDRGTASRADLSVEETGPNTGIFEGTITLNPAIAAGNANSPSTDVTINVLPGDIVSVRYEDEKGAQGQRTTVSRTLMVVSVDPMMSTDRQSYSPGQTMTITIEDLDANRDAETSDIRTLRVTSTTDLVGLTNVQAIETGPNTGVFEAMVPLSSVFATGTLQVASGDTITVEYEDAFPADFRTRFDQSGVLTAASKKFYITADVGADANVGSTAASAPALRDLSNNAITEVTAGQQVILSIDVRNNENQNRPFAGIVEVRDSNGFTTYLQWQTGTLPPGGTTNVGLSWTPEFSGEYTVRTFVVTNVSNPSALSEIAQTTVNVS